MAPALAQEVTPQKNWRRLESPHFTVIGNVGDRDLRRLAEQFEQFREAMALLFPDALRRADLPTTVVAFRNPKTYTPFKPLFNGKPVEVGGYFQSGPDLNFITLTTENLDANLSVVHHEFVHLIVNTVTTSLPLWMNEGLAEYYSTFGMLDGGRKVAIGRPVVRHVMTLRERFMPLSELVATDRTSAHYNEGDKRSIFYAESWALVHYLLLGNEQKYADRVGALLTQLAKGVPFADASRDALGVEIGDLEKELRRYVQRNMFVSQAVTFDAPLAAVEKRPVVPASEADVHATLGALLARLGRPDQARAQLTHALALDEGSSPAHAALGMLHLRAGDNAQAMPHLAKAASSNTASHLTQFYYAQGLESERAAAPDATKAAEFAALQETALRRAIELRPAFTESYHLLAHLKSQRPDGIDQAMALMGEALLRAPGRESYLLTMAYLHANRQRFAAARAIASRLAAQAADSGVQQAASALTARLDAIERQRALAKAVGAEPIDQAAAFAPAGNTAAGDARRLIPALRTVETGEDRFHGYLMAIECATDGSVVITVDDGKTRQQARAATFDAVEFITYRTDLEGQIPCGPRKVPQPVYLTWRPSQPPRDGIVGDVVAIEFLPDDYVVGTPRRPGETP